MLKRSVKEKELKMEKILSNQKGAVLLIFALLLIVLVGFVALGMEVGRWYLVRAELSKGVDAAALAAAKNISNPYVNVNTLVQEIGKENFPPGYVETPASGAGSISFSSSQVIENKSIKVTGNVSTQAILARLFGVNQVAVQSSGEGQKNEVEVMMILDRSLSMGVNGGRPLRDLKTAAIGFLEYFAETQDKDNMGLITFATGVTVDHPLSTNFVAPMQSRINALTANGWTNAEHAIDLADGPGGFTDQTGIPGDRRKQQFLIFFSDGSPTAFTGRFRRNGVEFPNAVVRVEPPTMNNPQCLQVNDQMGHADSEVLYPTTGTNSLIPTPTGDGNPTSGNPRTSCINAGVRYLNTRWYIFEDARYGLPRYGLPTLPQCKRPSGVLNEIPNLAPYICNTAKQMALDHAQELKDKYIKIYTIGLGSDQYLDRNFLGQIASGPTYEYYAPTSADLEAIFKLIAKEIKLRLVA